ncbi:MAG: hypothetical protein PHS79_02130 [Patescibacteria group bacterium]|nr:hypothetical protein [Patescibacteria group bacterium]
MDVNDKLQEKHISQNAENAQKLELTNVEADERALENVVESEAAILETESEGEIKISPIASAAVPTQAQVQALEKDPVTIEVEGILEKDMKDIFMNLPEDLKPVFKSKGEETSLAISEMVKNAAVKAGEVMKLIFAWLKIIPGVNKYFLEQEAKIKTDQIMELVEQIKLENDK